MDKRYLLFGALILAVGFLYLRLGGTFGEEEEGGWPSPISTPPPSITPTPGPTPKAPAQKVSGGFSRYIPNSDGDILWELDGETARFLSARLVEINRLTATSFDPEADDLVIRADDVTYDLKTQEVATEEGRIEVRREKMVLTGKGVQWTPKGKRIRVLEDVKFLIKETDNQGMFPL